MITAKEAREKLDNTISEAETEYVKKTLPKIESMILKAINDKLCWCCFESPVYVDALIAKLQELGYTAIHRVGWCSDPGDPDDIKITW